MDEYFTHHFVTPFIRTQKMCPVTLPSPFPHFLRVTKEQELWHFSGTSCLAATTTRRLASHSDLRLRIPFGKCIDKICFMFYFKRSVDVRNTLSLMFLKMKSTIPKDCQKCLEIWLVKKCSQIHEIYMCNFYYLKQVFILKE